VLDAIRAAAPISRAEVARRAGLSKPTVSLALQSLLEAGLVREVGVAAGTRGRSAVVYEPDARAGHVLAMDVGGRFLRAAIADLSGSVVAREDVEIAGLAAAAALEAAVALQRRLLRRAGLVPGALTAAVVGSPGVLDPASGRIWLADALSGLEGLAIEAELSERLGLPVTVENDVNLAALGEHAQGAARGVDDVLFLSVGSGLGAGLVLGGRLHRGHRGAAGEVDFVPFARAAGPSAPGAAIDPSANGLIALAESLAGSQASRLRRPFDSRAIFDAARDGDELAATVVAQEARWLALYLASVAAVVDVELAVLGGGIGVNGDLLLEPAVEELRALVPYPPRLVVSSLGERAVLAGALAVGLELAVDRLFENRTIPLRSRTSA
jgi:predicted NBD/HSP70 family sugar kinase